MQKKGKKFLAWLLMAGMLCSGNSVSAFAQDLSQNTDDMIQIIEEADDSYQMEEAESFGEAEVVEEDDDETVTDSGDDVAEEAAETVETTESGETNELFSDGTAEETDFSATAEIQQEETETVEVYFSVSHDNNYVSQGNRPASLTKLRVPYFDLALYGLENMYLAQGRDESGNLIPGTKETARNKVTMLHLFIYATEVLYCGVDEADAGKGYLKTQGILGSDVMRLTGKAGSIYFTQFWGMDQNLNYYLNYEYPLALPGLGATADQIVLGDEDVVTLGHFSDWGFYTDEKAGFNYLKIDTEITQAEADKARKDTISVEVYHAGAGDQYQTKQEKMTGEYELYYMPVNKLVSGQINTWNYLGTTDENGDLAVNLKDIPTGEYFVGVEGQPGSSTSAICSTPGGIYLTVTESVHECQWDEGIVTKKPTYTTTGVKTYTCTICGAKKTETIPVIKHTHKYVWKTTAKATIHQPEKQKGTCSLCRKTTTRNYGSKLKAVIKLNATSITLQKKQATKRIKVTMANGDSIKSWTSSNRNIVTVDKNGLIRAQNRTGSAKITVTLKSGKKATLNVKVQTAKVRITKISGLKSSMVIKKGQKETLKPVVSPLTSTDKVTYTTSNKNIAVVSSTGVITAKKNGTAKITVRSGAKSYVIKVTVK